MFSNIEKFTARAAPADGARSRAGNAPLSLLYTRPHPNHPVTAACHVMGRGCGQRGHTCAAAARTASRRRVRGRRLGCTRRRAGASSVRRPRCVPSWSSPPPRLLRHCWQIAASSGAGLCRCFGALDRRRGAGRPCTCLPASLCSLPDALGCVCLLPPPSLSLLVAPPFLAPQPPPWPLPPPSLPVDALLFGAMSSRGTAPTSSGSVGRPPPGATPATFPTSSSTPPACPCP